MAYFRQIHVSTWKDPWFFDLESDEKLLFIYLFSNENTSISGIYEIPFRVICFETGLDTEFVKTTLEKFEQAKKVYFKNGVIWVKNLRKYNASTSEKIIKGIENDLSKVPECPIKQLYISYYSPNISYTEGIGTISLQDKTIPTDNTIPEEELNGMNADTESPKPLTNHQNNQPSFGEILSVWKKLFPKKPQPRLTTKSLRKKAEIRSIDTRFVEIWEEALIRASESPACKNESWFTLEFFLRNDQNYQKCYDKWMEWKDNDQNKKSEPAGFDAIRSYRQKAGLDIVEGE